MCDITFSDRRTDPIDLSIGGILATVFPFLGVFYALIITSAILYIYLVTRAKYDREFRRKIAPEDTDSEEDLSSDEGDEDDSSEEGSEAGDESGFEILPSPFLPPTPQPLNQAEEKERERLIALEEEKFEEVSLHDNEEMYSTMYSRDGDASPGDETTRDHSSMVSESDSEETSQSETPEGGRVKGSRSV